MGASGRDILEALIAGQTDPAKLADLACKWLREKIPALRLALQGRVTEHHRFLLRMHLDHVTHLEELIGRLGGRIEAALAPFAESAKPVLASRPRDRSSRSCPGSSYTSSRPGGP
jgi:hypothetical protein